MQVAALSDRVGRIQLIILGALATGLLAPLAFWSFETAPMVVLALSQLALSLSVAVFFGGVPARDLREEIGPLRQ